MTTNSFKEPEFAFVEDSVFSPTTLLRASELSFGNELNILLLVSQSDHSVTAIDAFTGDVLKSVAYSSG